MKILSRILITVSVLLGVAFVVMLSFSSCQHEGAYAGGKACQATHGYKFGVDANGCESPVLLFPTEPQVVAWLNAAGVGKECYKIRFWKNGYVVKEIGSLAAIQCITKKGAQFSGPRMHGPGSGGTQKVMFNTPAMREAFEKKIKGAKE
jgi:hypothetical protein